MQSLLLQAAVSSGANRVQVMEELELLSNKCDGCFPGWYSKDSQEEEKMHPIKSIRLAIYMVMREHDILFFC